MSQQSDQALVIVGAGPAGLGPLFAAATAGVLQELLAGGVTVLEAGETVGCGALEGYGISSDSAAEAFLDVVLRTTEPRLAMLREDPSALVLLRLGKEAAPLQAVAAFLRVAGRVLCEIVAASEHGCVLTGATARAVRQGVDGGWETWFQLRGERVERLVRSRAVVLATGARQPAERLETEPVAGVRLLPRYAEKLLQSAAVMGVAGRDVLRERLAGVRDPRVVIVGGSTSAGTVATTLLDRVPGMEWGEGAVTMLHRRPMRIFYETRAEAEADGYTEFEAGDICRLTGRVFRLSGFRLESKALLLRARAIGGRERERRLELLQLEPATESLARERMERADLIVAAMGYQPRLLPVEDAAGRSIAVREPERGRWAVIDERCRVLRADGVALEGLFAMGLSVGPAASGELGGEIGFEGQVNSLWMWQHTLGLRVVEQVPAVAKRTSAGRAVKGGGLPRAARANHASGAFVSLRGDR